MIDPNAKHLDQIDLFTASARPGAGSRSKATPTQPTTASPAPSGAAVARTARVLYSVELLPDGSTRVTDNGRVTFSGIIRGARS